ncbi:hypothetical protein PMI54_005632, partial [Salmonella enterica]|nr:hypothetical protein [Salmonella enterica]
ESLCTAAYWVAHVMRTVRFADGVRTLAEAGVKVFTELGPQGTLLGMVAETLGDEAEGVSLTASLKRGRKEEEAVLEALGAQHVGGAAVKWAGVFRGDERKVSLPLYPWQRKRYWMADVDAASGADVSGQSEVDREAPEGQVIGWRHGGEAEQRQALLRLVCSEAARVLSLASADDIDSTQPLSERGLDSLMALELRRGLVKKTGLSLP